MLNYESIINFKVSYSADKYIIFSSVHEIAWKTMH